MAGMVCTGAGASGWMVVGVGRRAVGHTGPPPMSPAIATGGGADLATAIGGRPGLAHARAGARRRQKRGTPAQGPRSVGPSRRWGAGPPHSWQRRQGGASRRRRRLEGRAALPGGGGVVEAAELACARDWNRFGAGLRRMRRLGWGSGRFGDGKG